MKRRQFRAKFLTPDKRQGNDKRELVLPHCIMVKNKVAQVYKGRIRPLIFFPLAEKEFAKLMNLLKQSQGSLNRENYKSFLPYMLPLGFTKYLGDGYVALDIESLQNLRQEYQQKESSRRRY